LGKAYTYLRRKMGGGNKSRPFNRNEIRLGQWRASTDLESYIDCQQCDKDKARFRKPKFTTAMLRARVKKLKAKSKVGQEQRATEVAKAAKDWVEQCAVEAVLMEKERADKSRLSQLGRDEAFTFEQEARAAEHKHEKNRREYEASRAKLHDFHDAEMDARVSRGVYEWDSDASFDDDNAFVHRNGIKKPNVRIIPVDDSSDEDMADSLEPEVKIKVEHEPAPVKVEPSEVKVITTKISAPESKDPVAPPSTRKTGWLFGFGGSVPSDAEVQNRHKARIAHMVLQLRPDFKLPSELADAVACLKIFPQWLSEEASPEEMKEVFAILNAKMG